MIRKIALLVFLAMIAGVGSAHALSEHKKEVIREVWDFEQAIRFRGVEVTFPSAACANGEVWQFDGSGTLSCVANAAGATSAVSLDTAYDRGGAGAGAEIAVDSGPVIMTGTHGSTDTFQATASGSGNVIDITNTGTGSDIDGTSSTWSVSKAGAAAFVSIGTHVITANVTVDDGVTDSPSFSFVDATDETAAFVKTDAGVLGLTTDATDGLNVLTGNLFVGNGTAGTAAMDGEDTYLEGELEVDGAVQLDGTVTHAGATTLTGTVTLANGLTLDNATNNTYEWNENSEEILWTFASNALDLDSTTGVVALELFDGSTGTITHAADGGADDFTLSVTGAQDSSLIISSTGTGADAMQITTSAGGLDISVTGAAGEDLDIATPTSSVNVTASEADAAAIVLNAAAGGIDITSAATFDIDITATGGKILGVASEAAADQFKIDAQGTVAGDAINLETTDGGIMLNADGAANGDIEANAANDVILVAAGAASIDSADWDISATGAATLMASIGFDSASILYQDIVQISNAEIKALRAAPKELVAAQGADAYIELVSAVLVMDYGTNVLTESADNLVIEYATSGADVTAAIEMTGFIDQAVDQMAFVAHAPIATDAASDILNNALQLFNTGDGEFGGNAGADTTMTVHITYRVHTAGL